MINKKTIYGLGLLIITANICSYYPLTQAQIIKPAGPEICLDSYMGCFGELPVYYAEKNKIQVAILLDSSNSRIAAP